MKIDRRRIDFIDQPVAAVTAGPVDGSAASFATALRRHREREASHREGLRRSEESSTRRPSARPTGRAGAKDRELNDRNDAAFAVSPARVIEGGVSALCLPNELTAASSLAAAALKDTRSRRGGDKDVAAPCIEIVDARTGMRVLLSRENGVWLASVQSQPDDASLDAASLLKMLRTHFSERGLGPIDMVAAR